MRAPGRDRTPYSPGVSTPDLGPPPRGRPVLDEASAAWVEGLSATGSARETAVEQLHALLLRVARHETGRRAGTHQITGPELDDLAHQAASDATLSVLRRLDTFRGESRFTTWAYTFVVFEVSNKIGRHAWRRQGVRLDSEAWERLPARLGGDPALVAEGQALADAVRTAVDTVLTSHQRRVFTALVLEAAPLDALAAELGSHRNAIYKTMFDARRKVRAHLVTHGYIAQGRS